MTITSTSYTFRIRDGQFDAAIALLKEIKQSVEKGGAKTARAYYADVAGEWTGTVVLGVEYDSASSAGQAADKRWDDAEVFALSSKASADNSPLELVFGASYSEIEL